MIDGSNWIFYGMLGEAVRRATAVPSPEGDSGLWLRLSRHLRAGLSHAAAARLEYGCVLRFFFASSFDTGVDTVVGCR
jgi:hypothetical protein